jgi:transposase
MFGIHKRSLYRWKKTAVERGWDPRSNRRLLLEYCADAPKSGRPSKQTPELVRAIVQSVSASAAGREQSTMQIAAQVGVLASTVHRVLRKNKFRSCKRTMKPGLTPAMREARLQFCLRHKDWTLEDWKNVIWSDETLVVLGSRRGKVRVWRKSIERHDKTVITR